MLVLQQFYELCIYFICLLRQSDIFMVYEDKITLIICRG